MLGAGPVNITGLGAIGPSPTEQATVAAPMHNLQDGCPVCALAGLSTRLVADAMARVQALSAAAADSV